MKTITILFLAVLALILPSRLLAGESIDDASRLNQTTVQQIVHVHSEDDIRQALFKARELGVHVSIAGARHSMGGQTFDEGNIVLDMLPFNELSYDTATLVLTAQSGARWESIQPYLDQRGRSVKVMQSDNVFSVGGSLSVNAHGWNPKSGPLDSTVESFRLMLSSGAILTCSRNENTDLFHAVLGGYGLIGVILDVRLETVPNVWCHSKSYIFPASQYADYFKLHVDDDPGVQLAYGRMSVDRHHFLTQASLTVYDATPATGTALTPMTPESSVSFKNKVFRLSEKTNTGKIYRWTLEKEFNLFSSSHVLTRNSAMNADINVLKPANPMHRDILQEYFVPYKELETFLKDLRRNVPAYQLNLLNITLRDVRQDSDSMMPYARTDACAMVLFFAQEANADAEKRMKSFTRVMVESALKNGGSFYLPYRLHYTHEQFSQAYPQWQDLLALKRRYDPRELFTSRFYRFAFLHEDSPIPNDGN